MSTTTWAPGYTETAVRLADVAADTDLPEDLDDTRVCYWRSPTTWWVYLPGAGIGRLTKHTVADHGDGTITVQGSIGLGLVGMGFRRHGYLERGQWREV